MPRRQMLAQLEAVLGTTTRDPRTGEKVEIRGLAEKEMDQTAALSGRHVYTSHC